MTTSTMLQQDVSITTMELKTEAREVNVALFTVPDAMVGERTLDEVVEDMARGGLARAAVTEGVDIPEVAVDLKDCGSARYAIVDTTIGAKHVVFGVYGARQDLVDPGVRAFMVSTHSAPGTVDPVFETVNYAGIPCSAD